MTMIWLLVGYICWYAELMLFSFYFSKVIFTVIKFVRTFHSSIISALVTFFMFHILKFILTFSVTFLLAIKTGYKKTWLLAFIVGMIGTEIYTLAPEYIYLFQASETLPSYTTSTMLQSTIVTLIIIPSLAYLGCYRGKKH